MELLHAEITDAILKAYYHVYNSLGYGFLEKVYENSLKHTLEKAGFSVGQQVPLKVHFEGIEVGEYSPTSSSTGWSSSKTKPLRASRRRTRPNF